MDYIYALLRKYPNRIKYWLFAASVFAMIFAIRTYINYLSIEEAISNALIEKQTKTDELAFTQNFIIPYEQSEYASYFLQHENNMLLSHEFIIKFEEMQQKQEIHTWDLNSYTNFEWNQTLSNQKSWKKFILEKLKK